ncbi:MAG: recombinase family protein [bacterium]|nr:recombinase family protein [bacterium]
MNELATREGYLIKEICRESHSAKESGQRPVFKKLLEDIRNGIFTGILTWAQDINPDNKPISLMDYSNYAFRNGTMQEKREITNVLKRQLYIHNEIVTSVLLI